MTDKFAEFLKIASQLNKMGIVPLLMGSLWVWWCGGC